MDNETLDPAKGQTADLIWDALRMPAHLSVCPYGRCSALLLASADTSDRRGKSWYNTLSSRLH
jgi:hypothetical protein